jgi:hypothetical protein
MTQTSGVLGCMGPATTVYFLKKMISLTDADCDQEHVSVLAMSDPRIPDLSAAIEVSGAFVNKTARPFGTFQASNRLLANMQLRHTDRTPIKQTET